jgi:hypothetical protein
MYGVRNCNPQRLPRQAPGSPPISITMKRHCIGFWNAITMRTSSLIKSTLDFKYFAGSFISVMYRVVVSCDQTGGPSFMRSRTLSKSVRRSPASRGRYSIKVVAIPRSCGVKRGPLGCNMDRFKRRLSAIQAQLANLPGYFRGYQGRPTLGCYILP